MARLLPSLARTCARHHAGSAGGCLHAAALGQRGPLPLLVIAAEVPPQVQHRLAVLSVGAGRRGDGPPACSRRRTSLQGGLVMPGTPHAARQELHQPDPALQSSLAACSVLMGPLHWWQLAGCTLQQGEPKVTAWQGRRALRRQRAARTGLKPELLARQGSVAFLGTLSRHPGGKPQRREGQRQGATWCSGTANPWRAVSRHQGCIPTAFLPRLANRKEGWDPSLYASHARVVNTRQQGKNINQQNKERKRHQGGKAPTPKHDWLAAQLSRRRWHAGVHLGATGWRR
jgi:hypothetical protein